MEDTKATLLEDIHVLYEKIKGGRSTTYFGATGKARKELPWSNLLKFFLDPQGIHGFGSLVFDAFLHAGSKDTWEWYNANKPNDTVKVEREVKIPGGRFDIFVLWENDKGDRCAIVVENKLWSDLTDQLKRYRDYLEGSEYKNNYRAFVLSPYGANDPSAPQFKVLTYSRLMDEIRKVPLIVGDKNKGKWEYMLEDFIETAEKEEMVVAPDSISEEEIKLLDGIEIIDGIYSRIKEDSPNSPEPALSKKIEAIRRIGSKFAKRAKEERAFSEEMETIQEGYNKFRRKLDNQVDLLKEEYEKLRGNTCEKNCEPALHKYHGWRCLFFDFEKPKFRVEIYLSDNCTWSVSYFPRSNKPDCKHRDKFVKLLEGKGYPLEKIIPSEGTNIEVGSNILKKRRKATLGFLEKFLPVFKEAFEGFQWR